jgi:hypothetical protein
MLEAELREKCTSEGAWVEPKGQHFLIFVAKQSEQSVRKQRETKLFLLIISVAFPPFFLVFVLAQLMPLPAW